MQYNADSPADYLALLDRDWRRERLEAIRDMLLSLPGISEGIGYGMLRYERCGNVFAHLNAQKNYVGVYLGDIEKLDPGGEISRGLDCGKGCLRVRKSDDLGAVRTLISRKVAA